MEAKPRHRLFPGIPDRSVGFICVAVSALIMGCFGILVRSVTADSGMIAFSRFAFGSLFLVLYLSISKQWQAFQRRFSIPLLLSGVFLALCVLFYSEALNMTTMANAVFLLYLAPLIASLLGYCALKEKISLLKAALILSAFLGLMCLLKFDFSFSAIAGRGKGAALAAACCYALFIVANRSIDSSIAGFSRAVYQLSLGALVMLPFVAEADWPSLYSNRYGLLAIGFFQGFVALTLIIVSLRYLRVYEYATVSYLEPIVAALAGYLFFQETLSLLQMTGGALILFSGYLQMRLSDREE